MISKREKNYEDANNYFIESINEGNGDAVYQYGKILLYSSEKKEEGIKYYKKAFDKGCAKALYKYGLFLQKRCLIMQQYYKRMK